MFCRVSIFSKFFRCLIVLKKVCNVFYIEKVKEMHLCLEWKVLGLALGPNFGDNTFDCLRLASEKRPLHR